MEDRWTRARDGVVTLRSLLSGLKKACSWAGVLGQCAPIHLLPQACERPRSRSRRHIWILKTPSPRSLSSAGTPGENHCDNFRVSGSGKAFRALQVRCWGPSRNLPLPEKQRALNTETLVCNATCAEGANCIFARTETRLTRCRRTRRRLVGRATQSPWLQEKAKGSQEYPLVIPPARGGTSSRI